MIMKVDLLLGLGVPVLAVVFGFIGWKLASLEIEEREERKKKKRKELAQEIWRRYNHTDIELPDE